MEPLTAGLIIGGIVAVIQGISGGDDKGKDKDGDDRDNGCNCSIDQN